MNTPPKPPSKPAPKLAIEDAPPSDGLPADTTLPDTTLPDTTLADESQSDEAVIKPIEAPQSAADARVKGRLADKLAAIIAAAALGLSILLSTLFFAGFVANDYHIFAITSALALSLFLGGFAIMPMVIIMILARRAYRNGGNAALYLWVLFLALPWLGLSILCLIYTPLPLWMSGVTILIALTLTLWGMISLILDLKSPRLSA